MKDWVLVSQAMELAKLYFLLKDLWQEHISICGMTMGCIGIESWTHVQHKYTDRNSYV